MVALNLSISGIVLPQRMRRLPISDKGFPIPWFVGADENGKRDIRFADPQKRVIAVKRSRCWVCGEQLGAHKAFVIGPMCVINRVTAEPPCHLECAEYSAKACPFLAHPRMRRNERDLPEQINNPGGIMLKRNPGAVAVYLVKRFATFKTSTGDGGWLIRLPDPEKVFWFADGKEANRAQVQQSIESGYPLLLKIAEEDGAVAELVAARAVAEQYLPAA